MGFPFFNPPTIQKVNKIEEGNFFVATEGVETSSVSKELTQKQKTVKIIVKAAIAVILVTLFVLLGIDVITNLGAPNIVP